MNELRRLSRMKYTEPPPGMPSDLDILGQPHRVLYVRRGLGKVFGRLFPFAQTMLIRAGATPASMTDTIWHEVLHAIDELLDLDLTEKQVRRLATSLALVVRVNRPWWSK